MNNVANLLIRNALKKPTFPLSFQHRSVGSNWCERGVFGADITLIKDVKLQNPLFRTFANIADSQFAKFRDMKKPFRDEELDDLRLKFRSMPSHTKGFIRTSEDFPYLVKAIKWERTAKQIQNHVDYFHLFYGGKLAEDEFIRIMELEHNIGQFAMEHAKKIDQDGNGFISCDEFKVLLNFLRIHNPKLKIDAFGFEDFVKEAGTDNEGRVNLESCAKWIEKFV